MIEKVHELLKNSKLLIEFTGEGSSEESGIHTFRGEGVIWNKYDTKLLSNR